MKTTAAVLRTLQDYYASLPNHPSIKGIAQAANMPTATAARYLNGTTQQGDVERVRALCIALDRQDLLDELPGTQTISSYQEALALILEIKKESRESNLEELNRVRELHEKAEQRWAETLTSKDKHIAALSRRVEKLEADKEDLIEDKDKQAFINAELNGEMKTVREAKRKRDAALIAALLVIIALLILIIAYLIKYDLPNPGYGVFG